MKIINNKKVIKIPGQWTEIAYQNTFILFLQRLHANNVLYHSTLLFAFVN